LTGVIPATYHRIGGCGTTEITYTPGNCSWMNRIECQFTALHEFTLNGAGFATHREQDNMIRRHIAWRNRHTSDPRRRPHRKAGKRSLTRPPALSTWAKPSCRSD